MSRRLWRGLDRPLCWTVALLVLLGLAVLYSASYQRALAMGTSFLARQLVWLLIGVGAALFLMRVDYHRWLEGAYVVYGLNVLLLGLVLVAGETRGGAQRWLAAGPLTFQPSELAKLSTILVLARYLGSHRDGPRRWRDLAVPFCLVAVPMGLILKEPNLGTAGLFLPIAVAMLWVWGFPARILGILGGLLVVAIPIGWQLLHEYQRARLLVFINPNADPLGAGYTVLQSKIAIGSGLLWGRGWFAGTQNQLNFLPERHTDFIFSVVGLPLPFLSYGGSWVLTCLAAVGMVLSVGMRRPGFG